MNKIRDLEEIDNKTEQKEKREVEYLYIEGTLSRWKRDFLDGGRNALKSNNNSETKSELKKLKK